jgi:hypothetical protein
MKTQDRPLTDDDLAMADLAEVTDWRPSPVRCRTRPDRPWSGRWSTG